MPALFAPVLRAGRLKPLFAGLRRWIGLILRVLVEVIGELLAPARCASCDEPIRARIVFCPACAATVLLVRHEAPLQMRSRADVVAALYGGAVANALKRLKFGARADLARPMGELLRAALRDASLRADVVVPVPLHPHRLVARGYNQAALLADVVAADLGLPLDVRALARVRDTRRQAQLPRAERGQNVAGAFRARRRRVVSKRVVVVDDVVTTGATLRACVDALLAAGAASVATVAVAMADAEWAMDEADSVASRW